MARRHSKLSDKGSRGPSQRQLRVGELIRHRLAEILARGELHDEVIAERTITIPEVRMTADLRMATVYVMPLGGEDSELVIDALNRNRRFIRGQIAVAVDLKFAPDVRFRFDESFVEGSRIDALLASPKVRHDTEK
jgi:ribosome-binding factor A